MILTRIYLNPQRRGARKLLMSPQAMHAAILAGFPPGVDPGRVLWRVDGQGPRQTPLWVVSAARPDFTHLEEQAGWPSHGTTTSQSYDGVLAALAPEQQWAFRLTANPAHRAQRNGRSQVFAHVTADQQTQWLLDRQERMGVALTHSDGSPAFTLTGRDIRRFRRGDAAVTLGTATFAGTLRVEDADRLRAVLCSGLGRGKAYGCGLLTLARP